MERGFGISTIGWGIAQTDALWVGFFGGRWENAGVFAGEIFWIDVSRVARLSAL
jgi:hypothetical protein